MINEYENELPFEIPSKWVWCNLGMLFSHNTGKALNASKTDGVSLTYITTSNVYWNSFELDNLKIMPFTDSEIEKCTVKKGDLLVCEGGDIGRAAIWQFENEIRIQNHLHRLRPYDRIYTKFYYYIMYLYKANGRINGNGIGLQGLSSNALHNIIVPVPPVEEQKRIVDNIDSVLSLIEQIESHKQSLSSQIDNIKSKILDLAIHGKLVPQDPNDEPASVLLERIRAEKEELIKQGKIKRDKKESVIFKGDDNSYYEKIGDSVACIDAELPFEIPDSWCWARLSSFTEVIMGSSPRSQDICSDSNYTEFHQGKIYFSDYFLKESNQYTKKISKIAPENSVLLCVREPFDYPRRLGRGRAAGSAQNPRRNGRQRTAPGGTQAPRPEIHPGQHGQYTLHLRRRFRRHRKKDRTTPQHAGGRLRPIAAGAGRQAEPDAVHPAAGPQVVRPDSRTDRPHAGADLPRTARPRCTAAYPHRAEKLDYQTVRRTVQARRYQTHLRARSTGLYRR